MLSPPFCHEFPWSGVELGIFAVSHTIKGLKMKKYLSVFLISNWELHLMVILYILHCRWALHHATLYRKHQLGEKVSKPWVAATDGLLALHEECRPWFYKGQKLDLSTTHALERRDLQATFTFLGKLSLRSIFFFAHLWVSIPQILPFVRSSTWLPRVLPFVGSSTWHHRVWRLSKQ